MPLSYPKNFLLNGETLYKQSQENEKSIAPLLKKVREGKVGNLGQVLKSGLKKAEVEKILEVHQENASRAKFLERMRGDHIQTVSEANEERRKDLDLKLQQLKKEYQALDKQRQMFNAEAKKEIDKYPTGYGGVLTPAAEKIFKQALEKLA